MIQPDLACPHTGADTVRQVCAHVLEARDISYRKRFTGSGLDYDLLCEACAGLSDPAGAPLRKVCAACFLDLEKEGSWEGIAGQPQILERPGDLRFAHDIVALRSLSSEHLLDLRPIEASPGNRWIGLTRAGDVVSLDLSAGAASTLARLPSTAVALDAPVTLHLSPDGGLAAIVNSLGQDGVVLDLTEGRVVMPLKRDDYHSDKTVFPVAFAAVGGRTLLVHGTAWNRLDISDPRTGVLLTDRGPTSYREGEEQPPHYLDYFQGGLSVSPDGEWIVGNGWVWAPVGIVDVWSLRRWCEENVWESEDGPSKASLCHRWYYWDGPLCWVDHRTLAVWGYGEDDEWLIPAIRLFDVVSRQELRWFAGPEISAAGWPKNIERNPYDSLLFDTFLFSLSREKGIAVWDVARGERLLHDGSFCPDRYHRGAKRFVTLLPDGTFRLSRLGR